MTGIEPRAFCRHVIYSPNFLQCRAVAIRQAKAHFEDLPLPLADGGGNALELLFGKLKLVPSDGLSAVLSSIF